MVTEQYRAIIEDPSEKTLIRIETENIDPIEKKVYLALWYSLKNRYKEATKQMIDIYEDDLPPHIRSILIESKLLEAYSKGQKPAVVAHAKNAINFNPDAILACLYLGLILRFDKNQADESIGYFKKVLSVFPDHNGAMFGLVYPLVTHKNNQKEALELIKRCRPSLRKSMYRILVPFAGRTIQYYFFSLSVVLLFFIIPIPALYTLIGIVLIGLISEIVILLIAKQDTFLLSAIFLLQLNSCFDYVMYLGLNLIVHSFINR